MTLLTALLASLTQLSPLDRYYTNWIGLVTFSSISSTSSSSSCLSSGGGAFASYATPSKTLNDDPIALPFASGSLGGGDTGADLNRFKTSTTVPSLLFIISSDFL